MIGGLKETRQVYEKDRFERDFRDALLPMLRESEVYCQQAWSALANVEWHHGDEEPAAYSFRAAGDLIAACLEAGNYLDWYCSGPAGVVADWIEEALQAKGWRPEVL